MAHSPSKMLMIIIDHSKREELEAFLVRAGVEGYTELSPAAGTGVSGPRMGSGAFPSTSAVVFSVLDQTALTRITQGIEAFCASCGEKLRMFTWDVTPLR